MTVPRSSPLQRAKSEVITLLGKLGRTQAAARAVTIRLMKGGTVVTRQKVRLCITTWRNSAHEGKGIGGTLQAMNGWRRSAMRHAGVELMYQICVRRETKWRSLHYARAVFAWRTHRWYDFTRRPLLHLRSLPLPN